MTKKRESIKKQKIRYVLLTTVDLDPTDAGEITDLIERNRELGTCEITDISIVEVEA